MIRHVTCNIDFLLGKDDQYLGDIFEGDGAEIRKDLEERKANGALKIGAEGCEGFDPVKGCPGHFKCKGCSCELTADYSLRTEGWCYLCDPNITLEELLSDKPIDDGKV